MKQLFLRIRGINVGSVLLDEHFALASYTASLELVIGPVLASGGHFPLRSYTAFLGLVTASVGLMWANVVNQRNFVLSACLMNIMG